MADLRTDYQDDVLNASENTARVYDLVDSNGTVVLAGVHLEDKTVYTTEGDDYGAADINTQNGKINELSNDLSANSHRYQASYQNGKYGFLINNEFYQIGGNEMELKEYGTGTIASSATDATVAFTDYQPEDLNYVVILNSGIVGHAQSGGYAGGGGVYLKAKTLTGFTVSCEPQTIGSNMTGYFSYQVLH